MTCNAMAFFNPDFMLHPRDDDHHHPHSSLTPILPSCTPQDFHGVASLLGKRSMSFSGLEMCEEMNGDDDLSDDCSQAGEKKRRLNIEQVKTLEKNFELGNKLEPERKMQLARALGLQPRQIAIWFQNRRARWKTKQLEKDYDLLKRQFEALKADNDLLRAQNKKFQAEILVLKKNRESETINLNKETEGSCSNRSDNSSDLNLEISKPVVDSPLTPHPQRPIFPATRSGNMIQLLQNTSRTEVPCQKIMAAGDHDENPVQEENFCNMFIGIDDHSTFWPWQDHCPQNFH